MKNIKHLEVMLEEKGIDLDQDLDLEGQINLTPRVLLEYIRFEPAHTQVKILNIFAMIDFKNGDVMHFLLYLGRGLVQRF